MRRLAAPAAALAAVAAGTPAVAQQPICVAVVVDYRELRSGVSTYCAEVPPGTTGSGVLEARAKALGRPRPQYRADGLICTIDGLPAGGCGEIDATHYWAYHVRAAGQGSWTYSNRGPATRKPRDGDSDGWVWMGGDGQGSRSPANVPYATVCPPDPTPSPPPTRPSPPPTAVSPRPGATRPPVTTSRPPAAGTSAPARPATPAPTAAATGAGPAAATPTATASGQPEVVPSEDTLPLAAPGGGDGGFPWGAAGGLALAAAIGGAAALRRRRA